MADLSAECGLEMQPFSAAQMTDLSAQFGYYVTVSNPFDYNTSIWGDGPAQVKCFTSALAGAHDAAFLVYDHPSNTEPSSVEEVNEWLIALDAFIAAHKTTGMPAFVISTISELLPKSVRDHLVAHGVVPLQGLEDGVHAYALAASYHAYRKKMQGRDLLPRAFNGSGANHNRQEFLSEWESKCRLKAYGLPIPHGQLASAAEAGRVATEIGYPVAVKASGGSFLHKSELGAVKLMLNSGEEVVLAVKEISQSVAASHGTVETFLVEHMVTGAVAELIIGIKRDEQFGPALVIGAGGILVELMTDSVSLLLPVDREAVAAALGSLKVAKLLRGYRGKPAGDIEAVIDAILSIAAFAEDHWGELQELDVNPLLVLPEGRGAVAVDALICMQKSTEAA